MTISSRAIWALITCGIVLCLDTVTPAQLWVARYSGPGNNLDEALALAVDYSGNVYVTGVSEGIGTGSDYATIKYSPDGDTIWVRRYNGPGNNLDEARALAVDDSGNVYVTGRSEGIGTGSDYATIKYSPDGDTIWVRRYNGPGNSVDRGYDLAVDYGGNVYVTGRSEGIGTGSDYATVKYSPNGDTLWTRLYNGPGDASDAARTVAVDYSGNVHVTGVSGGIGTSGDYATIKYSSHGDTTWVRRYNGPDNNTDQPYSLTVDESGNVYVTGWSLRGGGGDYATIKYSPDGDTIWVRRYNGPGDGSDRAYDLAVDESGNVCVTGSAWGVAWPDYATVKYSPNGDTIWTRLYKGPGDGWDAALALAVDYSGNVYVTGVSEGIGTGSDYATMKYSPDGDTIWVRRYNGPGNNLDEARALAVDDSGNVYVTGGGEGIGTALDYTTIKYSNPTGDVNCDGWVNATDVSLLRAHLDSVTLPGDTCSQNQCDVNLDGTIDEDDYTRLVDIVCVLSGGDTDGDGHFGICDNCPAVYNPPQDDGDADDRGDLCDNCLAVHNPTQDNADADTLGDVCDNCPAVTNDDQAISITVTGDVNLSSTLTSADIIYLVNFVFKGQAEPQPCEATGDVNCSGTVTSSDIVYMVNHVFKSDVPPCNVCQAAGLGWTCP